ncbi:hypothetical protein Q9G87_57700 [Nonomuraea sp. G32]|nr:hypothetical protein [Nonomuraea sp. G32]MDP4511653.1 hypothetical protein [Nonomuraea sp. G32]
MLQQRDADQPGPQESGQGAVQGADDHPAGQERQCQRQRAQRGEGAGHPDHGRVGQQVRGVAFGRRSVVGEQPAQVGVGKPPKLPAQAGAEPVGRVRIARLVGEGVMAAMDGDPVDDVALKTHRPGDGQRHA